MKIKSAITGKIYEPGDCVYVSNMLQAQRYLATIGPEYLYDILWNSEKRPNSLVFVFVKCAITKAAKAAWDAHSL